MQLTTTNNTANDIYNILIDINGHNAWTLNMDYFTMLYEDRNFWSVRSPKNLSSKSFKSYVEFAMYEVPWGLGWDKDIIKAHCKIPTYIWQEYEEQINPLKTYGGDKVNFEVDISTSNIEGGTSRQYQIQRLKRDAPDIATKVINRELSAKQGMEMAGLKDKTVVVKCKAEDFLIKAINNLEINQLEKLNYELQIFINNFNNERK
jgi:hypothetical protein